MSTKRKNQIGGAALSRRGFLKAAAAGAGCAAASALPDVGNLARVAGDLGLGASRAWAGTGASELSRVEARYYEKHPHMEVECTLCPRKCKVGDMERGYCGVRENQGGTYYTLVHSRPCSLNVDPIEKKPFSHFLPSTLAFSIATAGCNVNCKCCQNWSISQVRPEQVRNMHLPPAEVVERAVRSGSASIAYTYTEPIIFYEYMIDIARLARSRGVKNVMITGGYINKEPLVELCRVLDGIKVDLKAFTESFYKDVVSGELGPVLEALKIIRASGVWLEIVYLVIPTLNDDPKEIGRMAAWIKAELGPHVPVHFSRFHPQYLLKNLPATPVSSLERCRHAALEAGLKYVYLGNVPGHEGENTVCHSCGEVLVRRVGYRILANELRDGRCRHCKTKIPGVWS